MPSVTSLSSSINLVNGMILRRPGPVNFNIAAIGMTKEPATMHAPHSLLVNGDV